jgi:hypothetical protein
MDTVVQSKPYTKYVQKIVDNERAKIRDEVRLTLMDESNLYQGTAFGEGIKHAIEVVSKVLS